MNEIKVSVIIPVYNTSLYLEKCLRTVMNQSLKEIEIICVNDGSTDNSLEILERLQKEDNRIIIINKENGGLTSARNAGLKIAKGKYIIHIDSDDWIEQNYLKDMYKIAIKYDADMIISDFYYEFQGKKVIYQVDQYGETGTILDTGKVIENLFLGEKRGFPAIWNKLVKKNIYTKNNISFPEGISIGEDLATTVFLIYFSNKIIKLNKAYLHYIQNSNGLSKNYNFYALLDIYYVLNKIENFFRDKDYDLLLKTLRFNHLSDWIFKIKPKYENDMYSKILLEYIQLLEEKKLEKEKKEFLKYYFIFRKIFTSNFSFKIIWKLLYLKRFVKVLLVK